MVLPAGMVAVYFSFCRLSELFLRSDFSGWPRSFPALFRRGDGRRWNRTPAWFVLGFLVACGMMQLIPAFQSPDEIAHLLRADMISHGQPVLRSEDPGAPGKTGGLVDVHFLQFAHWMQKIVGPHREDLSPSWLMDQSSLHTWYDDEVFVNAAGTGYYAPFIYAPHALGLKVSRELDLSMRDSYELTRVLVTLLIFGVVYAAWQVWQPNLLVKALVLMPMALFQIISPTIDGLCFALALLVLSLFFLQWQEEGRATGWQAFAFYLAIFLLVTSRTNLVPIVLLPLVLLLRHCTGRRLLAMGMLLAAIASWVLYALLTTEDNRVPRAFSSVQIIGFYVRNPGEFLALVGRTIADPVQGHRIASSFVGNLGWGDAPIPGAAMVAIGCGLFLAAILTVAATRYQASDIGMRAVLLTAGVGSALMAFFLLAVTWNDYPARVVEGLQGRYFIIPALFMAAAMGSVSPGPVEPPSKIHKGFALLLAIFCLCVLAATLQGRYGMSVF